MNLALSVADQIKAAQATVANLTKKISDDKKTYAALGGATPS